MLRQSRFPDSLLAWAKVPIATFACVIVGLFAGVAPASTGAPAKPVIAPVDHVPIAVRSLDAAAQTFRSLGFHLKPGRLHANGLNNWFVKFADGRYLELISPQQGGTDSLSRHYAELLKSGEGGAFLALRTNDLAGAAQRLAQGKIDSNFSTGDAFSTLALTRPSLAWLFVIEYRQPVKESPALYVHANTARGLVGIGLSPQAYIAIRDIQSYLSVDGVTTATGHGAFPVAGVTLQVESIETAQQVIRQGTGIAYPIVRDSRGNSMRIPASAAHGLAIQLLEPAGR